MALVGARGVGVEVGEGEGGVAVMKVLADMASSLIIFISFSVSVATIKMRIGKEERETRKGGRKEMEGREREGEGREGGREGRREGARGGGSEGIIP